MSIHEEKNCPRCQGLFTCKYGDISRCQCYGIKMTSEERALIEERYDDCICLNCLEALSQRSVFFKEKYFTNAAR